MGIVKFIESWFNGLVGEFATNLISEKCVPFLKDVLILLPPDFHGGIFFSN